MRAEAGRCGESGARVEAAHTCGLNLLHFRNERNGTAAAPMRLWAAGQPLPTHRLSACLPCPSCRMRQRKKIRMSLDGLPRWVAAVISLALLTGT